MTSTQATIIIPAESIEAARADMPGSFTAEYTTDAAGAAPATHYVGSGHFLDTELDFIVNEATWPRTVRFGDAGAALAELGLVPVVDVSVTE